MQRSVHYRFINVDITIPDLQVEATGRIGAHPGLVVDRRPLGAEIGEGYQITGAALLAFGKTELIQRVHLPTGTKLATVYNKGLRLDKAFLAPDTERGQGGISYRVSEGRP